MELVVEDTEGRVLGERDLEGSRWEQVGNHFTNLQDIAVAITRRGNYGDMYIRNGNNRIGNDRSAAPRPLDVGVSVFIAAGEMQLNWYEQHTQVWGDRARDHGVGGSQIEFTRAAAVELRVRANEFQVVLAGDQDVSPDLRAAGESLLGAVYDLLASLKVSAT